MKKVKTNIGTRIKNAREEKKVSLDALTEKTGLKKDYLKELEENDDTPNMAEVDKISKALGIRPGTFLDGEEDLGPVISSISKATPSKAKDGDRHYIHFFSLTQTKKNRHMDAYIIGLDPSKANERKVYSSHEGEEFLYVLEGSINVIYGKETYTLKEGNTIYYDSIVPHFIGSANDKAGAKVLSVAYFPA